MGLALSWIATKDGSRETVFDRLDLEDTGEAIEAYETPAFWAELPNGWLVMVFRNFDFVSTERLLAASQGVRLVGCAFEEHVMVSAAWEFADGRQLWNVTHDPGRGGHYHLEPAGCLPAEFEAIRDTAVARQDVGGGEAAGADFLFEVPLDVARAVCGFHHVDTIDELRWLAFVELVGRSRGLWKWLTDEL